MIMSDFLGCSCCDLLHGASNTIKDFASSDSLHVHKLWLSQAKARVLQTNGTWFGQSAIQDCCLIQNHNDRDENQPFTDKSLFQVTYSFSEVPSCKRFLALEERRECLLSLSCW